MKRALLLFLFVSCAKPAGNFSSGVRGVEVVDAGEVDAGFDAGTMLDRCIASPSLRCFPFDLNACAASEAVTACVEAAAGDCTVTRGCYRALVDGGVPFVTGASGIGVKDLAGNFTVPTTDGVFDLQTQWTGGESYVFLAYTSASSALFGNDIGPLLDASPHGVHYFFSWKGTKPAAFDTVRTSWLQAINARADREYWLAHVHFLTTSLETVPGWVGQMMTYRWSSAFDAGSPYFKNLNGPVGFAIDRSQRIRELGMLGTIQTDELAYLANHVQGFEYEVALNQRLAAEQGVQVVTLADRQTVHDTADFDVTLPDLASFDTLETDLAFECPAHLPGNCGAWDYLSHLWLCDSPVAQPDGGTSWTCDQELARWITSYWSETRHVTDVSQQLAALSAGPHHLRFWASGQFDDGAGTGQGTHYRPTDYIVTLKLRFSTKNKGIKPVQLIPLWSGGDWNSGYDATKLPIDVAVPSDAAKVELAFIVTGHGGVSGTGCAEFCDHQHHFTVNGAPFVKDFPEAQSGDGCAQRIDEGVTPNQFGTWYYGRGGWCPGTDVPPVVFDVTSAVTKGANNTLTYSTTYQNAPLSSAAGAQGNIVLSSWLVIWK